MNTITFRTILAGGLVTLLAACHGDDNDNGAKACVALLVDDNYVDYTIDINNGEPEGSEAANMEAALKASGHTVLAVTGVTAADFTAATADCGTLVIPEQERGSVAAAIGAVEQGIIKDFVTAGGNLILTSDDEDYSADLVNDIFGWSVGSDLIDGDGALVDDDSAGTPFAGGTTLGGTTLTENSQTFPFIFASLPPSTRIIYEDDSGDAVVSMTQVGSGTVTLLGWDFFDAQPLGSVDDGWIEVLTQAVSADALEMTIPLTDVALADLQAKGWSTCFTALYDDDLTTLPDALATCTGSELMLACRETGDPVLTLAAGSPKTETMVDTGTDSNPGGLTNDYEGISWYFNNSWSWGFASRGDSVEKDSCDTDVSGKDNQRLCWHIDDVDLFGGGYRCGETQDLNDSVAWERVLLTR